MRILNCFKITPDLDKVLREDWKTNEGLDIDISYVPKVFSCFDESSLEIMLRLSDSASRLGINCYSQVITVGDESSERFLKMLYALGVSKATRISGKSDKRFNPLAVAYAIKKYIDTSIDEAFDLILMGIQSTDEGNLQTPFLLSEILGLPCIANVTELEIISDKNIRLTSESDDKTIITECTLPLIVAIGNSVVSHIRIPTLKDKMTLGKKQIEVYEVREKDTSENTCILTNLEPVNKDRQAIEISGETTAYKAEKLYNTYLKERLLQL